nr:response regulator [Lachnospiraceae bacterium]
RVDMRAVHSLPVDQDTAFILYAESGLAAKADALITLKDRIIETKAALFVIEGDEGYEEVKILIPDALVTQTFRHPLDAKTIGPTIINRLQTRSRLSTESKKVMIVDDSEVMLTLAKNWLEDKYQVTCANSGTQAIKYLSLDRPDLMLLDYEMPIVSGKILFEMIRSDPDFSGIPVIFLTGQNDKKSIMEVLELKPEGYLLKSMEPGEIIKAIDDFFLKQSNSEI